MVSVSVRQNRPEPKERNPQEEPHPENPGLVEGPGGYYDWAGRRLFLEDGSPDPATPGAYRYQTRPDLCDLEAPDSEPSSPRYEPPHLRHRPGDTWEIGGKPYDPEDRGPYGSPRWRQDRRTGRHRRGELPDPIPPREEDEPQDRSHRNRSTRNQPARDRPSPSPKDRGFWTETDHNHQDEHRLDHPRFGRLREGAWADFMSDSEPLAAAHREPDRRPRSTAFEREAGGAWALWIWLWKLLATLLKSLATEQPARASATDPQHHPIDRDQKGPQVVEEAVEPLIPHARTGAGTRTSTMARAIAGAQRARAGVAVWA